jgi:hypothetical protein
MSVQLHYLEVFDGSLGTDYRILMIGLRDSLISNNDLNGIFGDGRA